MAISFGDWLTQSSPVAASSSIRAQIQASRTADKLTSVVFLRDGLEIAAQSVRVEYNNTFTETSSELGVAAERRVTLFAPKGHPTIADLNVRVWDTFRIDEVEYSVMQVNRTLIGQVQVQCEAVG